MPAKPTVFISYRRQPAADLARYIHHRLSTLGYDTFLDVETINGGRFANIIQKEIINRDVFVVILTPDTLESVWVVREVKTALDHQKPIIPLAAQGFSFSSPLPTDIQDLSNYDAVRWENDFADAAFERLAKAIDPTDRKRSLPGGWLTTGAIIVLLAVVGLILLSNRNNGGTATALDLTPSLTDTPTLLQLSGGTATRVIDSGATATEAILQRTVIAQEATNAALMTENAHFVQTITATLTPSSSPTLTPTPRSTSGLVVGGSASVRLPPGYNNLVLRSDSAGNSLIRAELLENAVVTILEGPVAADNRLWWRVRAADGIEGWGMEAIGSYQMLMPVTETATPSPTAPTAAISEYPCTVAITGTSGALLNQVRLLPRPNAQLMVPVPQGSTVDVLEAPINDFGKMWYHIRYNNGETEGWITEDYIKSSSCTN